MIVRRSERAVSLIAASPFSAGQLSTLLGVTSPTQDVANGLSDLLAPTAGNPIGAMDGILASLTPASRTSGAGVASHFGPAATVDLETAILERSQRADDSANAQVEQTLNANQSNAAASSPTQSTGSTVDISA